MIVVASKPGQLGNRLFVFANFIACAEEHKLRIANPAFDEYAAYFQTTGSDFFCRYPARKSLWSGNKASRNLFYKLCFYAGRALAKLGIESDHLRTVTLDWDESLELDSPDFLNLLRSGQILFAQGWLFRSEANVKKHAATIKAYFTPLEYFQKRVAELIEKARRKCDVLVGVHIRHGDYRTFENGKYFYEVSQYIEMIKRVEALFPETRVGFLVCSNAAISEDALVEFTVLRGTDHLIEDMYSFAQCDYLIGPPSTYTMWASFYGEVPLYIIEDISSAPRLEDFRVI